MPCHSERSEESRAKRVYPCFDKGFRPPFHGYGGLLFVATKSNQKTLTQVLSAGRSRPSLASATLVHPVHRADTLTLQSVRGFADGTSMYRDKRSSSLTRPLRGLFLTDLQGSAATKGSLKTVHTFS